MNVQIRSHKQADFNRLPFLDRKDQEEAQSCVQSNLEDLIVNKVFHAHHACQRLRSLEWRASLENKSILDNIALPLTLVKQWSHEKAIERARGLLREVGLPDKEKQYPSQLSGGQKQRISIARALALEPEVILFDEPTSALDPELVQDVLDLIQKVTEKKVTSIIVTHELRFARKVADQVVFIEHGNIVEQGSARQVLESPKKERTAQFIGNFVSEPGIMI